MFSRHRKFYLIGSLFVFLIVGFFVARAVLPGMILHRLQAKIYQRTNSTLSYRDFHLKGVMTASFDDLKLVSAFGDTILYGKHLEVQPSFWALFKGSIALERVSVSTLNIRLTKAFLDDLLHPAPNTDSLVVASPASISLQRMVSSSVKALSRFLPSELSLERFSLVYVSDSLRPTITCDAFRMNDDSFNGDVVLSDIRSSSTLVIEGTFPSANEVSFSVHGKGVAFQFPYLANRWGITSGFDTLNFRIRYKDQRSGGQASGVFSGKSVYLFHKDVSPDTIRVADGGVDFLMHIRGSEVELDSLSQVHLNGFKFSPYIRYKHGPQKEVELIIPKFDFVASQLLQALPVGLFPSFKGLQVEGKLAFALRCYIPFSQLDSVRFHSSMESEKFHVLKFGDLNPYMLRDSFYHEVYERGRLVAAFPVNPGSPQYASLDNISDFLTDAVLTSEDGSYFYHRGFNEEAFRNALVINLKKGRFVRGASTITMQLVKNAFLTRQKNISRKLEEAAWVWMIENLGLLSKNQMLEVYFNIVEWGPGVYGITNASKFYFDKAPSALTLSECIYLSMLLPRPKQYIYFFNEQGKLRESLASYYKTAVRLMLRREWISESDTVHLIPQITLTGPAKAQLRMARDTIIPDSTLFLPEVKFL